MHLIKTRNFELAVYSKGDQQSPKLALVLPGKLDTKDYPHMRGHVDYLATQGYFALSFDPPGSWESPGDISLYTMANYLTAINDLVEYFGNRPTFVMGHSRGGSMAILAGTQNPHIASFAAVMSFYSFDPGMHGGYPDQAWQTRGYRVSVRDLPNNQGTRKFQLPYSFLEEQVTYDLSEHLKTSRKPKMFVVGEKDTIVKPEFVRQAFEIAAEPKFLYTLDSGHDYRTQPPLIERVNEFVGDFLEKSSTL